MLNLDDFEESLRPQAEQAFADGNALRFLGSADNCVGLRIIQANWRQLIERGIYEPALLDAYISTRTNNRYWPTTKLDDLFNLSDRAKLLAAGDELPPGDSFTIYRGVSGDSPYRRVISYSWTLDRPLACWFASKWSLADPAVYRATIKRADVLAYFNGREEQEVICRPKSAKRLAMSADEIKAEGELSRSLAAV